MKFNSIFQLKRLSKPSVVDDKNCVQNDLQRINMRELGKLIH